MSPLSGETPSPLTGEGWGERDSYEHTHTPLCNELQSRETSGNTPYPSDPPVAYRAAPRPAMRPNTAPAIRPAPPG